MHPRRWLWARFSPARRRPAAPPRARCVRPAPARPAARTARTAASEAAPPLRARRCSCRTRRGFSAFPSVRASARPERRPIAAPAPAALSQCRRAWKARSSGPCAARADRGRARTSRPAAHSHPCPRNKARKRSSAPLPYPALRWPASAPPCAFRPQGRATHRRFPASRDRLPPTRTGQAGSRRRACRRQPAGPED